YLGGLERAGRRTAAYYAELGPLVRVEERIAWDHVPGGARGAWLAAFWERRAAEAGVSAGERIAEHYRRLEVAGARYRRGGSRDVMLASVDATVQDSLLVLGRSMGLDDRGTVYLLHGEPSRRVGSVPCAPNESWHYRVADGDALLFHFRAAGARQLVLTGDPAVGCPTVADAIARYEDLAGLDPRLGLLAGRLNELSRLSPLAGGRAGREQDLRMARLDLEGKSRAASLRALRRDSYRPDLGRPLDFYYDTYAFRGAGGATRIVFALAAPGDQLPAGRAADGSARYPVGISVVVFDSVSGQVFRADSARTFAAPAPLGPTENLRTSLELTVPPGTGYAHRVTLRAGGVEPAGGVYGGPMEVLDFRGDTIAISDLVLAEVDGRGWRRGEVELGLVPPRRFRPGDVVTLYYELYSPPVDAPVATRIHVEPLSGGGLFGWLGRLVRPGAGTVTLDFVDPVRPSAAGVAAVLRTVDLRGLAPGGYRLRVEVEARGRRISRSREFLIQEP
ncbi:MAG TPA: hypothetical protein VMK65_07095, partial [Longimicrobiales bacterium]|nr:hypothetical protein [Longimicrobiales bacterium]